MTTSPVGNIADLVRDAAASFGDRPALIGDGDDRSWAQLDAAADSGAAFLAATGAGRGDRVLLALPNSADLAVALIAVARAGLVAVPVDPARTDAPRVAGRVQARIGIAKAPDHELPVAITRADVTSWWTTNHSKVAAVGGGEDLAQLARASRISRAVMIPHRAVLAAVAAVVGAPGLGLRTEDRALLALPLHHLAGFVTAFLPLTAVGGAAVLPGPVTDAAADSSLLTAIRQHRVTILPGSPPMYRRLLRAAGAERALATVRLMTSGAAPLLPADFSAARALTGQSVWEGYGISESTSVIATSLMTAHARPGSVGLPVTGLELRIIPDAEPDDPQPDVDVDVAPAPAAAPPAEGAPEEPAAAQSGRRSASADTLADVGSIGEVGRIAIRGPTLFLGYWPDAADGPAADGWYVTADVGYADDSGELHLVDRVGDTFVVAGFTVYPREIERVLADHPYVADAAVVGVRTDSGTAVVAVIAPQPGKHPTDDDLAEFLAARLPMFKRPTVFQLVSELPRTELGRVDRPTALADYAAAAGIDLTSRPAAGLAPVTEPQKPAPTPDPENAPEAAAPLDQLGRRLPGAGPRGRSSQDGDDDLFGDDYS